MPGTGSSISHRRRRSSCCTIRLPDSSEHFCRMWDTCESSLRRSLLFYEQCLFESAFKCRERKKIWGYTLSISGDCFATFSRQPVSANFTQLKTGPVSVHQPPMVTAQFPVWHSGRGSNRRASSFFQTKTYRRLMSVRFTSATSA